jgi:membrane-bound lytic murein transglycosylase MltF
VGDIVKIEPNVHAGVKYIASIRDKYFASMPMDDLNKALFAFAAYNAGPSKIMTLRSLAEKRGLDPNVWFDNVEIIAADKIGRETVTYVRNIYKYYIAYRLVLDRKQERDAALKAVEGK